MNISTDTPINLHLRCLEEVKQHISIRDGGKHAFKDAAQLQVLEPGMYENPVSYNGSTFVSSNSDSLFLKEIQHYNELISPREIEMLVDCLKNDIESKKAYLSVWQNEYIAGTSGEIPCLVGVHAYVVEGVLHMVAHMRSNELLRLLSIDISFGIALQSYVAQELNLLPGSYTHQVSCLVLYSKDVDELNSK